MKKLISLFISLAFAGSSFAQMSGYSSSQSDGTTLGANETLTADGIALGNAVKLRGYVDFVFKYDDEEKTLNGQNEQFDTSADVDFLFDLSPVTAELHLNVSETNAALLEQAFGRYSVSQDFHFTFGRQLTSLGFEADEAPGLYAVTTAHVLGDNSDIGVIQSSPGNPIPTRRNYVDGIRLNYNNGMFGFILGLHDGYWTEDHFDGDDLAIDLAGSVMFFPGLEARLGYAHQSLDKNSLGSARDGDIGQFNAWLAYNPGALTLATEFDNYDIDLGNSTDTEYWSWMLLANYQFTDWFAGTLRYTHEDVELAPGDTYDSDRITFALLFSLTDHFGLNVEYSTTSVDNSATASNKQGDYNEFLVEGLITY
jgi:hypothetical protein